MAAAKIRHVAAAIISFATECNVEISPTLFLTWSMALLPWSCVVKAWMVAMLKPFLCVQMARVFDLERVDGEGNGLDNIPESRAALKS